MATILVVDDHPTNRELVVTLLGYADHRLLEASDGVEALDLAKIERPDLMIVDILMPTMDGFELVRQLREDPTLAQTPVIFSTATYLGSEARSLAEKCGVSHILFKPSEPELILNVVNEMLGVSTPVVPQVNDQEFLQEHLRLLTNKLVVNSSHLQQIVERLTALISVGQELTQEQDPQRLLEKFCHAVRNIVGAKYAALGILNDDGQTLRHFYVSGLTSEHMARIGPPPTADSLMGRLIVENQPIRIDDLNTVPRHAHFPPNHPTMHSFLGTPVKSPTRTYGWLYVTDKLGIEVFDDEDEQVLVVLAGQVAVTYENAQLYDQLRHHAAELEMRVEKRSVELIRAKEHVEAILNNTSDAILVVRMDGTISQANTALGIQFDYDPQELVGRHWQEFFASAQAQTLAQQIGLALTAQQPVHLELEVQRKDESNFHADIAISVINRQTEGTASDARDELIVSIRDITIRKRAEEELRKALEKERELGELKSRFVSMASHEFRTPLATILALTETLSAYRHRLTDEQIEQRYGKIKEQVGHLKDIMEDVLLLARMQARRVEFNPVILQLDALCRSVLDEFQTRPDITHHMVYTCNDAPREVRVDRKLMRQIINNLVSNAIKYSAGGATIMVNLDYTAENVVFSVRDEGIGIPEADLKHLFEPFHRAANVGNISGTGLGLVITKESVDLHGGAITVESQVGVGTTFSVSIPIRIQEEN